MGYRTEYGSVSRRKNAKTSSGIRVVLFTIIFLYMFAYLVNSYWPEGREVLQKVIWPADMQTSGQVVQAFVKKLRLGIPIWDAVESFCREIVGHAG